MQQTEEKKINNTQNDSTKRENLITQMLMDNYSLMKELEFANYNTEANKQGWSYEFITKFINSYGEENI